MGIETSQAPTKGVVELVVHYYQPEVATFSHGGQITVVRTLFDARPSKCNI